MDFGAAVVTNFRARMRLSSSFRTAIICLAICSLTVSLATRFTVPGSETPNLTVVRAHAPETQRQRLLGDGLKWTAPTFSFTLFEPRRSAVYAASAVFPSTNLSSESWLYNRPPPSC
jgi:hypothetical protein